MLNWRAGIDWRYRRCIGICLLCLLACMFVLYFFPLHVHVCLIVYSYICRVVIMIIIVCSSVWIEVSSYRRFSNVRSSVFPVSLPFHFISCRLLTCSFCCCTFGFISAGLFFTWTVFGCVPHTSRSSPPFAISVFVHGTCLTPLSLTAVADAVTVFLTWPFAVRLGTFAWSRWSVRLWSPSRSF